MRSPVNFRETSLFTSIVCKILIIKPVPQKKTFPPFLSCFLPPKKRKKHKSKKGTKRRKKKKRKKRKGWKEKEAKIFEWVETKDENSEQDAELDGLSLCAFFQEKKSLPADTAYFLLTFQGFPLPIFFFSSKKGRTSTTVTVCSIFRLSFPNCRTPLFVEFDAPNYFLNGSNCTGNNLEDSSNEKCKKSIFFFFFF